MKKSVRILLSSLTCAFAQFFWATAAWAQDAAPTAPAQPAPVGGFLLQLPILAALALFFYFAVIQPQKKQAQRQAEFQSKLSRGDEVVTSSGIIGTVRGITDKVITLETSPGNELKVLRSQVSAYLKEQV